MFRFRRCAGALSLLLVAACQTTDQRETRGQIGDIDAPTPARWETAETNLPTFIEDTRLTMIKAEEDGLVGDAFRLGQTTVLATIHAGPGISQEDIDQNAHNRDRFLFLGKRIDMDERRIVSARKLDDNMRGYYYQDRTCWAVQVAIGLNGVNDGANKKRLLRDAFVVGAGCGHLNTDLKNVILGLAARSPNTTDKIRRHAAMLRLRETVYGQKLGEQAWNNFESVSWTKSATNLPLHFKYPSIRYSRHLDPNSGISGEKFSRDKAGYIELVYLPELPDSGSLQKYIFDLESFDDYASFHPRYRGLRYDASLLDDTAKGHVELRSNCWVARVVKEFDEPIFGLGGDPSRYVVLSGAGCDSSYFISHFAEVLRSLGPAASTSAAEIGQHIELLENRQKRYGPGTLVERLKTFNDPTVCLGAVQAREMKWRIGSEEFAPYVEEAQRRGFTLARCLAISLHGVQPRDGTSKSSIADEKADIALRSMTARNLCAMSLNSKTLKWDESPIFRGHVREAKRRGYSLRECRRIAGDLPKM